jgi:hypothetical protein
VESAVRPSESITAHPEPVEGLRNAKLENANLSGANLRYVNLGGAALQGAQLTNLISIEGADFTDVSDLSDEAYEYLNSIASGSHPSTFRQTAQSLKYRAAPEKT